MSGKSEILRPVEQAEHTDAPMAGASVSAGFPSPADDYVEMRLDLNRELVRNPASTFFVRVSGSSMSGAGIEDGDLLVVDKSVEAYDGSVAVCWVDGEFTLKRVEMHPDHIMLVPANPSYKPLKITADNEFTIWGVVRYAIKKF